jgi:hypothetical protein
MSRHRSGRIPQRKRVLISCEGASERSYGTWLHRQGDVVGLHLHIDPKICKGKGGGGDLLTLMEEAEPLINRAVRDRVPYRSVAVLIDGDLRGQNLERDEQGVHLATRYDAHIIWQETDYEAFLLRHLNGHAHKRPQPGHGLRELIIQLPNYEKPWNADQLGKAFDPDSLRRAAAVDEGLRNFLRDLNWPL